jgi:phage-related baseplate assembly protein
MLKLLEVDSAALYDQIIQAMEIATGEPLYPGDERRIFTEAIVQLFVSVTNMCNTACNNKMLQYAEGEALDALGYRMGVERLPAVAAQATFEFTLSSEMVVDVTIPAGTLITTDGDIYFATDEDLIITPGNTTGTVTASCTEAGEDGNGYAPGAIAQLVDAIDHVQSAINTTTSEGGVDEEDDEDLRDRIHLSNSTFSTAGPTKAYEYWAKTADSKIIDVVVDSPSACIVNLYILTEDGLPTEEILQKVKDICSADDVRPLTDEVNAIAPTPVEYDIEAKYYTTAADEADCVATIEGEGGSVDQYIKWQAGEIGRDINPNKLLVMCMAPSGGTGCVSMEITSPAKTIVGDLQVAQIRNITITHEVLEV